MAESKTAGLGIELSPRSMAENVQILQEQERLGRDLDFQERAKIRAEFSQKTQKEIEELASQYQSPWSQDQK